MTYAVKGKSRTVGYTNEKGEHATRDDTPPAVEFHSGLEMLRWAIRSGEIDRHRSRGPGGELMHPKDVYLGQLPDSGEVSAYSMRGTFNSFCRYEWTSAHWRAMHDAQQRLRSLWRYVSEVEPEWQDEEKVAYMDNSVELVQVDKYGNRRRKTLEYPSGDACF